MNNSVGAMKIKFGKLCGKSISQQKKNKGSYKLKQMNCARGLTLSKTDKTLLLLSSIYIKRKQDSQRLSSFCK